MAGTIRRRTVGLTPPSADVSAESLAETALRWAPHWKGITREPSAYLPTWAADEIQALAARVQPLPGGLQPESLCHFDVRDDNLLLTGAGNPVVLDWGNPRPEFVCFPDLVDHHAILDSIDRDSAPGDPLAGGRETPRVAFVRAATRPADRRPVSLP